MRRFAFFMVVLVFVLWFVPLAGAVEIFYPSDKTYFRRANYLIIRGQTPQLEAVVIAFNGLRSAPINVGDPGYRKVFKDILIIPGPPFVEGLNEIVAEGYVGGKLVRSAHASVYFQPDYSQPSPPGFQPFVMHVSEQEAKCSGCHKLEVDTAEMSVADVRTNPCLSCHKALLKNKYVHGPVGSLSCGDCHDQAKSGQKYPVPKFGASLCNECHDDKNAEFKSNEYVHGPVAVGMCETCHDPHGSSHYAQLIAPVNEMCLECHEQVATESHVLRGATGEGHPLEGPKDPSNPNRKLSCIGCHNPHASNAKYFLAGNVKTRWGLCSRCHTDK